MADAEDEGGTEARRGAGRPRDAALHENLLTATLEVLAEKGYESLTVDAVAQRAGVGRPTVYRRWPQKPAMVLDALRFAFARANPAAPDTGDVKSDLVTLLNNTIVLLTKTPVGPAMRGLAVVRTRDPELASILHGFERERRAIALGLLRKAKSQGRLRAPLSPKLAFDLLLGPIYLRLLVTGDPLQPRLARALVDAVVS